MRQKSYTSFGKLILATEKSKPIFSFTKADRFSAIGEIGTLPQNTPGPKYNVPEVTYYKFDNNHKWRIGTAKRRPLNITEKYEYFNHTYNKKDDLSRFPKKWGKTIGGAIGSEHRIKYDYRENTPGPGRYTPSMKSIKPKSARYFIGEKIGYSALELITGTKQGVGPGTYRPESAKYFSHHIKFPEYSIGKAKRKELNPKPWTKNESYWIYSSIGNQIPSGKRTEEMVRIGKSTRERENKRGSFKSMMERKPMPIKIPMPKL